jgi:hypothetical protein
MVYLEMLCGLKVNEPSKVMIFGRLFDNPWLSIQTDKDSDFGVVMDRHSVFSAHMVEHGHLVFKITKALDNVSFHQGALATGQVFGADVTLGLCSRVFFTNSVLKNSSGVFYGTMAMECSEDESTVL